MSITGMDVALDVTPAAADDLAIIESTDDLLIVADQAQTATVDHLKALDDQLVPFLLLGVLTLLTTLIVGGFLAL